MTLKDYVIRRSIVIVPTFFLISIIIFALIHAAPGDPVTAMTSGRMVPVEIKERLRIEYGLDQPIPVQYALWLNKLLHGDLGYSYVGSETVWNMISVRIPLTVELMLVAELTSVAVAVVLGVIAAVKHNSITDAVCSLGALVGYSTPDFWLALMLVLVFALSLGWLPPSDSQTMGLVFTSPLAALSDHLQHLLLPVVALVCGWTAYLFRIVRSSMLEVLSQDYVITARAKGLKERVVIYKHALRNALLPVITYLGYSIGFLLGGAAVIEEIFNWPGLGQLMVEIADKKDYPTLMGLSLVIAIMVLVANLVADVAYAAVDPRIKYD
jgi:peptide/nickel transport system permease protein